MHCTAPQPLDPAAQSSAAAAAAAHPTNVTFSLRSGVTEKAPSTASTSPSSRAVMRSSRLPRKVMLPKGSRLVLLMACSSWASKPDHSPSGDR